MPAPESATTLSLDTADGVCRLHGPLDFSTATRGSSELAELIRQNESLQIDMSGVSASNSAGLALMIECLATADKHGHQLQFTHVPESLRQLATVCRVDSLI